MAFLLRDGTATSLRWHRRTPDRRSLDSRAAGRLRYL